MTGSDRGWEAARRIEAAVRMPQVGIQLNTMTNEVIRLGTDLLALLDNPLSARVSEALATVKAQHSRIAVIGQIKAGKSSFVNALIGRPGFLPTDVNPWTAVLTNLHFAVPGQPRQGAQFRFFDETEWHQLGQRADTVGALTEKLLPGHAQVQDVKDLEALHRRAEVRLGRYYHQLFGKTRWYSDPTPEIIERYVCLGQDIEHSASELVPGRYADITKAADIFLDAGNFAVPATLIDTPGTNDPLLVRDDVTMNGIRVADVYVVVLTARQPLTAADLSLLRVLHGLQKSRIIVFINRADELSDIAHQGDAVVSGVKAVLQREFPAGDIPVVIGSARWANAALQAQAEDLERLWDAEVSAYAHGRAVLASGEGLPPARTFDTDALAEAILAWSGVPAMMAQISSALLQGVSAFWLSELAATLLAVVEVVASSFRKEVTAQEEMLKQIERAQPLSADLTRRTAIVEQLRSVEREIGQNCGMAETRMRMEVAKAVSNLSSTLEEEVRSFAAEQAAAVRDAWLERRATRNWHCDGATLRNSLEAHVLRTFREVDKTLFLALRDLTPRLPGFLQSTASHIGTALTATPVVQANISPSLAPLGRPVVFDLDDSWWTLWWNRGQSAEENARKIEELVMAEFGPVATDLWRLVEANLQKHAFAAVRRFFTRASDVICAAIDREEKAAVMTQKLLSSFEDTAHISGDTRDRNLAEIRSRLAVAEAVVAGLRGYLREHSSPGSTQRAAP